MSSRHVFTAILTVIYVFFLGWFLKLYLTAQTEGTENLLTNFYGIIPLLGGVYGLILSRRWGGWRSAVGRAVVLLSAGLLTWGLGIAIWIFYNLVLQVEVPYPSWADIAFIVSWPLWGLGMVSLSKATGAQFGLRKSGGKVVLLLVPLLVILFSYYMLVVVARGGTFEFSENYFKVGPLILPAVFFDLAYPVGDVVILALATLVYGLSYRYFGGKYRSAIYLILAAFVLNYFADFTFSYTTTTETYYNGSLADVLFATTMFVFSLGICMLDARLARSGRQLPTAREDSR